MSIRTTTTTTRTASLVDDVGSPMVTLTGTGDGQVTIRVGYIEPVPIAELRAALDLLTGPFTVLDEAAGDMR